LLLVLFVVMYGWVYSRVIGDVGDGRKRTGKG